MAAILFRCMGQFFDTYELVKTVSVIECIF
jgi:hypothetical protein